MTESIEQSEAEVKNRTCSNCACFFVKEGLTPAGMVSQSFCRKNPPMHAVGEVDVPAMRNGEPIVDRDGKPRMMKEKRDFYIYAPTLPDLVCFDGWRERSELPGQRLNFDVDRIQAAIPLLAEGFAKIMEQITDANMAAFTKENDKPLDG
jgi:hypothetical protein